MNIRALFLRTTFWLKDFLKGSPIRKPYNEIKFIAEHSYEEGLLIRETKLKKLLQHAVSYSKFYKGFSEKFNEYPIMNKSLYLKNYDAIKVDINNIPGQIGKLHIQSTSGSTGTPFSIPQDTRKRQRRIAELKYYGEIVGYKSHEKLIHLRTWNRWHSKTPKQIIKENIIPFDISEFGEEKIKYLCKLINKEEAICLRGYASSFKFLSNYVKEHPYTFPSLKIIIAGSETLHEDTRQSVKNQLKCEIISQYANEECGILAQERIPTSEKDNPLYLNHASYYFEVLGINSNYPVEFGELGRIVVTDLDNYAFPIIRYDTGDIGMLLPPNEYSNGYPIIGKLYGRQFDICYTTDGQPFFPLTIGRILKHYDNILQWQFIQNGKKDYILKLVLNNKHINSFDEVINELKEYIGIDAHIKTEIISEIPILASGKRKSVINEWKR